MIVRAGYEDLLNTIGVPEYVWKFGLHCYVDHKVQYMKDTYALSNFRFSSEDIITDGKHFYLIKDEKLVDGAQNSIDNHTVVYLYSFFSKETKVDFQDNTLLWKVLDYNPEDYVIL